VDVNTSHHLYVVTLRGGEGAFVMGAGGNPRIEHDPDTSPTSVHTLMLTPEGAEQLVRVTEGFGVKCVVRRVEGMTEEQRVEQARLLGRMGQEERVWPTASCPSCFWFDPLQERTPCGAEAWPVDVRDEAYKAHASAQVDLDNCPLQVPRCPE
jgi:hypothetical protein